MADCSALSGDHHTLYQNPRIIQSKDARGKGYEVIAWDVNDEFGMKEMIRKGVTGIETDYPDLLRRVVVSMRGSGR